MGMKSRKDRIKADASAKLDDFGTRIKGSDNNAALGVLASELGDYYLQNQKTIDGSKKLKQKYDDVYQSSVKQQADNIAASVKSSATAEIIVKHSLETLDTKIKNGDPAISEVNDLLVRYHDIIEGKEEYKKKYAEVYSASVEAMSR